MNDSINSDVDNVKLIESYITFILSINCSLFFLIKNDDMPTIFLLR